MFSLLGWRPDGLSTFSRLSETYPPHEEEESSIHASSCWERPWSLALQGCDDFLAYHVLQTLIRRMRRRKGDLAMGMPMGLWPQSLLIRMIRMGWVAHWSYQWTSFWVGYGDSPFLEAWFSVSVTALQTRGPSRLVGPWRWSHPSVRGWMRKSSPRKPEGWPRVSPAAAAHRLPSAGALPEPWAAQGSSELSPSMDQASSGVSLGSPLCLHGYRLCRFHLRTFQSLDPWPYGLWLKPTGASFLPIFAMSMLVRIITSHFGFTFTRGK